MTSLVVFHQPGHDVHVEFEVHEFPRKVPVEDVVFLWEHVGFHSQFVDGVDKFSAVESGVKT